MRGREEVLAEGRPSRLPSLPCHSFGPLPQTYITEDERAAQVGGCLAWKQECASVLLPGQPRCGAMAPWPPATQPPAT